MYGATKNHNAEVAMRKIKDREVPWVDWLTRYEKLWKAHKDERYPDAVAGLCREGHRREYPQVSRDPAVQAFYVAQRLDGTGHRLAEMFALAQPPCVMTDNVFLEGHCNGNQFEETPWIGDAYHRQAEAAGVDTKGAIYVSGLAAFPGDPRAWVRDRGDVQRVCEERGYNCSGAVTVKSAQRDAPPDTDVADDIVAMRMLDKIEADPSLALKDRDEVFHETREELKPHWAE